MAAFVCCLPTCVQGIVATVGKIEGESLVQKRKSKPLLGNNNYNLVVVVLFCGSLLQTYRLMYK